MNNETLLQIILWIIYLQPILWILVYDSNINLELLNPAFYYFCIVVMMDIYIFRIYIDVIKPSLLIQYIFWIMICTWLISLDSRHNFKECISLAFMIVWINSYYWEFPFHLAAFIEHGLTTNAYQQILHLTPLPFILARFQFRDNFFKYKIRGILIGLGVGFVHLIIRYNLLRYNVINNIPLLLEFRSPILYTIQMFNRFFCMMILIVLIRSSRKWKWENQIWE